MSDVEARMRAHDAYDLIEEQFNHELDGSLGTLGPDSLFRYVAEMALPSGAVVVDVGCGKGEHAIELAIFGFYAMAIPARSRRRRQARDGLPGDRFGFQVTGVDPSCAQRIAAARWPAWSWSGRRAG